MTEAEIIDLLKTPMPPDDCGAIAGGLLAEVPPTGANLTLFGNLVLRVALGQIDPDAVSQETWHAVLAKMGVVLPPGQRVRFEKRQPGEFTVYYPHRALAEAAICETRKKDYTYDIAPVYLNPPASAEEFFMARVGYYSMRYCR